jgi:hypothetical protein
VQLSRFQASLPRAFRGGCIRLGGLNQGAQREMSIANGLKNFESLVRREAQD